MTLILARTNNPVRKIKKHTIGGGYIFFYVIFKELLFVRLQENKCGNPWSRAIKTETAAYCITQGHILLQRNII